MSDEFNNKNGSNEDKLRKIDEFFNQFEERTKDNSTNVEDFLSKFNEMEKQQQTEKAEIEARRETRMDRLNEKKIKNKKKFLFKRKVSTSLDDEVNIMKNDTTTKKKKHKHRLNFKKFILFLMGLGLLGGIVITVMVFSIISKAPDIDPNNIYSYLNESSTIYDDQGNVIDNLHSFSVDGTRKNVQYSELPQNLIDAFVSLEDKTFWDHHGFNFIRIVGAVKDGITTGKISGTSTITQQLARNLYLPEKKSQRTLNRKITEAYYTVLLEKNLTKEEIIEAYLNTIYLGYNSYGVQAASQAYFSKDVKDLNLIECAALAAMPQAPHRYALIKKINPEDISNPEDTDIMLKGKDFYYVYNDISTKRRETCLKFMNEQGYITDSELSEALAADFKDLLKPSSDSTSEMSSYFADYVVEQVTDALVEEGYSEEEANQMIYTGGLQIQTTLNSDMQKIAENEFSNNKNFPGVAQARLKKDGSGNILSDVGNIMLYNHNTYFQSDGSFLLSSDDYKRNSDNSLTIYKGNRLSICKVEFQGKVDYNLEFKKMYTIEDGVFYSIEGGVVAIPAEYKSRDAKGNLVISSKLFTDAKAPKVFHSTSKGLTISSDYYTLKQKVVQPQSAMVISDPVTGSIKAMLGGRNTVGRLLRNRAINPRQPGSSIKPIGVYGPALQASVDALNTGNTMKFSDSAGVSKLFGDYFTAASVIDDTPLIVQGKQWPKNWYSGFHGLCTMRKSLEQSVNVNAVRMFQQLGVQKSLTFLKKVGVSSVVESGQANDLNAAALALGGMTNGISPLEMSAAYGTFVNDGKYSKPIAFTQVKNNRGEVLIDNSPQTTEVMDPGVAFIMRDMLRTVVTNGLGKRAAISNQPVAGKTGTTTNNYDAWFVGFTPQYSAAIWIGNDINIELSQGSAAAAKLWSNIMGKVCAKLPTGKYNSAPSNVISVTVDSMSGKLPSSLSSLDPRGGTVHSEYFIKGTEPKTTDNVHTSVTICTETGYLATPSCTSTRTIVGIKRPYTVNPVVGDIRYEVPHYYCPVHNPDAGKYPVSNSGKSSYNFNGAQTPQDNTEQNNQDDSNNDETNSNGNNTTPPENSNTSPNNDGNTDENGNSTVPDWIAPH